MLLNGKFQCNICIYKACSRHDGPSDPVSHMKINDHQNHFSNNGRQRINAQRQLDFFYLFPRMERISRLPLQYLVSSASSRSVIHLQSGHTLVGSINSTPQFQHLFIIHTITFYCYRNIICHQITVKCFLQFCILHHR